MLKLASVFQDHAVLQRDATLPVWGQATPLRRLHCTIGNICAETVSNGDGKFHLLLPPQSAGGPFTLSIEEVVSGEKLLLDDLWFGDVYLASGQSNMGLTLERLPEYPAMKQQGKLDNPNIRYFKVPIAAFPVRAESVATNWQLADSDCAGTFSAVAFLFADELYRQTGVKVGILEASCGGTGAECWISREGLLQNRHWRKRVAQMDQICCQPEIYEDLPAGQLLPNPNELIRRGIAERYPVPLENLGEAAGFAEPGLDDSNWEEMELPDSWTLSGHHHAGVFWFRHEVVLEEGRDLTLSLGVVDKGDITYFNGVEIGRTGDGIDFTTAFAKRIYHVPGHLVRPGRNLIAVRAASQISIATDGGLTGPSEEMFLDCGTRKISLAGSWKFFEEHDCGVDGADFMSQTGPGEPHSQHLLFDNMIAPLIPFALRGVVWYQGECNAITQAAEYRELLETLIDDWRYRWGQPELDFLIVQLPGYQTRRTVSRESQWALLREAQMEAGRAKNAAVIVSCDSGSESDLHPLDKIPLSHRLAATAAALIAGKLVPQFPTVKSVTVNGSDVRIHFDTDTALHFKSKATGFALAGPDQIPYPAQAELIEPDTIIVRHPGIMSPQTLYYNWSNFPKGTLYSAQNLPAAPFRHVLNARKNDVNHSRSFSQLE